MHQCLFVYVRTYGRIYVWVLYVCACTCVCAHACMNVLVYVCMRVGLFGLMFDYMCVCLCVCVRLLHLRSPMSKANRSDVETSRNF